MKKKIIGIVFFIMIFLGIVNIYRASNLSKQFDGLPFMEFELLGTIEYNGTEHLYKRDTVEFDAIQKKLFALLKTMQPTNYIIKRGESKKAGSIIAYRKDGVVYKLYFGYAADKDTIRISIHDKHNFSIVKHYYLKNNDAEYFFELFYRECSDDSYDFCQGKF